MSFHIRCGKIRAGGADIFYREAGREDAPVIVLFHGFPTASYMFSDLMPILAEKYHVIAPDYPGFGESEMVPRDKFAYTFDHLASVMDDFLTRMHVKKFAMYIFDYGAPIGMRIACKHPDRITAIISQNGNVYEEGLGEKWKARAAYWAHPTEELRESFKSAFRAPAVTAQYMGGEAEGSVLPDHYTLDLYYMSREGEDEIQSDLIYDYRTNVAFYPTFQKYLRTYQPPLLAIWGKNDVSFIPAGAKSFQKDLPNAVIRLLDAGHFALETHSREIGNKILQFLAKENI